VRRTKLAALLVIGIVLSRAASAADATIKVGFCAKAIVSSVAPFAIATKLGFWGPGTKVQVVPIPGSTDCVKAVATGDIGYSLPSIEPIPALLEQGVKAKIFYTAYQGNIYGVAVAKDSPVRSIRDLKGKKIGVASMGSAGVHIVRGLFAMNGLDPDKDAHLVVVGESAQAAALLRSQQVAALSLYDTQYALVEIAGQPIRLLDSGPLSRFPSNGFFALDETLRTRRDEAVALAKGYAMGTVFALANPEAAVRILYEVYPQTRPTGKTEEQALRDDVKVLKARALRWPPAAGGVKRWGESSIADYDAYEDFLVRWKVIDKKVPATDLVTNELIDDVNRFDAERVVAQAKAWK
jgi:NitT/TauT family transport system substrate-binding protein